MKSPAPHPDKSSEPPSLAVDAPETPLPWGTVLACGAISFTEAFQQSLLYPFTPALLRTQLTPPPPPASVGVMAGGLAAAWHLGGATTAAVWGAAADAVGRRGVLVAGTAGFSAATAALGVSKTYAWAVGARVAAGLANGNAGVVKAALADATDGSNMARAFSVVGLMMVVGGTLGPVAGGVLADPLGEGGLAAHWGGGGGGGWSATLLRTYPYLLPCVVGAALAPPTMVATALLLRSPPRPRGAADADPGGGSIDVATTEGGGVGDEDAHPVVGGATTTTAAAAATSTATAAAAAAAAAAASSTTLRPSRPHPLATTPSRVPLLPGGGPPAGSPPGPPPIYHNRPAMAAVGVYTLTAGAFTMLDELFPLFASAPVDGGGGVGGGVHGGGDGGGGGGGLGGLGVSLPTLGGSLAFSAIVSFAFQLLVWPAAARRYGPRRMYMAGAAALAVSVAATPAVRLLLPAVAAAAVASGGGGGGGGGGGAPLPRGAAALLGLALGLRGVASPVCFTSVAMLVSNAAPRSASGAVNGVGQSAASLARGVAPLLGGGAWSLATALAPPPAAAAAAATATATTAATAAAATTTAAAGGGGAALAAATAVVRGAATAAPFVPVVVAVGVAAAVVARLPAMLDRPYAERPVVERPRGGV